MGTELYSILSVTGEEWSTLVDWDEQQDQSRGKSTLEANHTKSKQKTVDVSP